MNLRELYLKAMACTDNTEVLPDQEAGALKSALIQDINHAYFRIARERCAPRARVEVVLGEGGRLDVDDIMPPQTPVIGVKAVTRNGAYLRFAALDADTIVVRGARKGDRVRVHCKVLPAPLTRDADEPVFSPAQAPHEMLAYYAAAQYFAARNLHDMAVIWDSRFKELFDGIRPQRGPLRMGRQGGFGL